MKTIENDEYFEIQVRETDDVLEIYQGEKAIGVISKDGAKQLIEVLKEFINEPN